MTESSYGQILASPTLQSPSNGASDQPTTLTLDWNGVIGAISYQVQVSTTQNFNNPVIDQDGITGTSRDISGLDHETTYYWRVRATNGITTSDWSDVWNFSTVPALPQAPTLNSPPDNASDVSTDPTFSWDPVQNVDTYQIQVATDTEFTSLAVNESDLTSASYQAAGLSPSTVYYWRIRATNAGGTGSWSVTRSFTTESSPSNPPEAPSLASPSDGASGVPTSPTLNWNSSQGADTYHLQVATNASFSSPVINQSELSSTSYQASGLDNSSTYYWRVRASNEDGNSSWSAEWSFTTEGSIPQVPPAPSLESPSNGADEIPTNPTLQWNSAERADTYQLQVATDENFSNLTVNENGLTGTTRQIANLDNSTTYHWRVRASNEGGTGDWSDSWNFITQEAPSNPPETPTLNSPSDEAGGVSTNPILNWNSSQKADTYHLQIATDASFSSMIINESGLSATSYQASGLDYSTAYHWRVRASNEDGNSSWSSAWSFTTEDQPQSPPETPGLVAPSNESTGVTTSPTLEWNAAERAEEYRVQLADDSGFTSLVVDSSEINTAELQLQSLNNSTTYYWRVQSSNSAGNSEWSNAWTFTTESSENGETPEPPQLVSPENGATDISTTPLLDWAPSERANTYDFQIATDQNFQLIVINLQNVTSTHYEAELEGSTTYYWRVRARNSNGPSGWTNPWNFSTRNEGIAITIVSPGTKALWQAPNTHTIRWNATNQISTIRLEYSTDDGKSWNLISEEIDAGENVYGWKVPNISSVYTRIKISDEDNPDNIAISPPFIIYPDSLHLDFEFSFPSSPSQFDYKLIALPATINIPLEQIFSGSYGDDWQAYDDNGSPENYLEEYNQSEQFTFKPGRGFWVVSRENVHIVEEAPPVQLDADTAYTIQLHEGWNIISNPFHTSVNWGAVQAANNLNDPIWGFEGGFTENSIFEPFKGYYFFNRNNRSELTIPYKPEVSSKKRSEKSKPAGRKIISLSIHKNEEEKSSISFGVDPSVVQDPSRRYQPAPPGNFQKYKLTLQPTEHEDTQYNLAEIRRSSVDKMAELNMQLKSVAGETITLKAEGLNKLLPHRVALIHRQTGKTFHLSEENSILTSFDRPDNEFKIVVGTPEEIEQQKQDSQPNTLTLSQNYPNPFNGQTIIKYGVPKRMRQTEVNLEIFDILGRKVHTLVNSQRRPGIYEVRWNGENETGRPLASGVYYYRLRVGQSIITKKLTLIK